MTNLRPPTRIIYSSSNAIMSYLITSLFAEYSNTKVSFLSQLDFILLYIIQENTNVFLNVVENYTAESRPISNVSLKKSYLFIKVIIQVH